MDPINACSDASQGHNSRSTRALTNMRLSSDQEEAILSYEALRASRCLCTHARCHNQRQIDPTSLARRPWPSPTVNERWTSRFLQRYATSVKKKQIGLEAQRIAAYDLKDTKEWFRQLGALIQDKGIQSEDLWNMDESGFRIGVSQVLRSLTYFQVVRTERAL